MPKYNLIIMSHNLCALPQTSIYETHFLLTLFIPKLPQSQFNRDIFISNFYAVYNLCKPPLV